MCKYTIFHFFLSKWAKPLRDGYLSQADKTVSVRFREVPLYLSFLWQFNDNYINQSEDVWKMSFERCIIWCGRVWLELGRAMKKKKKKKLNNKKINELTSTIGLLSRPNGKIFHIRTSSCWRSNHDETMVTRKLNSTTIASGTIIGGDHTILRGVQFVAFYVYFIKGVYCDYKIS